MSERRQFVYEQQVDHFDGLVSRDAPKEVIYRDVIEQIREKNLSVVADIGCGSGRFVEMLCSSRPEIQVIYGDYSLSQVRNTRRKLDAIGDRPTTGFQLDITQGIPLGDGSVDALTLNFVVSEISDFESVLRESHRVLRDDGLLVVSMTSPLSDYITASLRLDKIPSFDLDLRFNSVEGEQLVEYHLGSVDPVVVPHYYRSYTTLVDNLHESGFRFTHYDAARYYHVTGDMVIPLPEYLVLSATKGKRSTLSYWCRQLGYYLSEEMDKETIVIDTFQPEGFVDTVMRHRRVV